MALLRYALIAGWSLWIAGGLAAFVLPRPLDHALLWILRILTATVVLLTAAYAIATVYRFGMRR